MDKRSLFVAALVPLSIPIASAAAAEAYRNLPPPPQSPPGVATNVEIADDLILDLSAGSRITDARIRIYGADVSSLTVFQLNIYTDNNGQPGTLLTTASARPPVGSPSAIDLLFDFPDVTLSSNLIWAGYFVPDLADPHGYFGTGTLPTIGSTTSRGANRIGPNSWNVNGASGPPSGGGYYLGDRLQISINTVPAPSLLALAPLALTGRRRRAGGRPQ